MFVVLGTRLPCTKNDKIPIRPRALDSQTQARHIASVMLKSNSRFEELPAAPSIVANPPTPWIFRGCWLDTITRSVTSKAFLSNKFFLTFQNETARLDGMV
jgi:hypothetical protein